MDLSDVKEGDEVYFDNGLYYDVGTILKVTKVTNTTIVCDYRKFRKKDGRLIGNTDHWHFPKIQILTPELRNKVKHHQLHRAISKYPFEKLSTEKLERIKTIINEEVKNENF